MSIDLTITITGLETRIGVLSEALHDANRGRADASFDAAVADARLAATEAERDALAAQLAEADKAVADAWRAEVANRDAEIARLTAERDMFRVLIAKMSLAVDSDAPKGDDCADGWRLLADATLAKVYELAAARAVPADGVGRGVAPAGRMEACKRGAK